MADQRLKEQILAALEWEADLDISGAAIAVNEGLVTLSGRVSSSDARACLEAVVLSVAGVVEVSDDLEIAPAPAAMRRNAA